MHKEKFIASMLESTNICIRQLAVENKQDLIELEKQILQQEAFYTFAYSFAYDRLIQQKIINQEMGNRNE
jgi:hypothetical protein